MLKEVSMRFERRSHDGKLQPSVEKVKLTQGGDCEGNQEILSLF
jgi:hypothetical protein